MGLLDPLSIKFIVAFAPQEPLDTNPPIELSDKRSIWELGNRFLAGAREMLYLTLHNSSAQIL